MDASATGHLVVALAAASALAWLVGAVGWRTRPALGRAVHWLSGLTALLAAFGCLVLGRALYTSDFSLAYVADTSSRSTPAVYRVSALWGAMDGSLLLWIAAQALVLAVGLALARRTVPELVPLASAVGAALVLAYLIISRLWADPFAELALPAADGRGLLAILQHPAMVYHPPILYLGLVVLAVPFALTMAALVHRRIDQAWLAAVRPWLRTSWVVLVVGMLAGSHWAYVELGWGGFWAWDPVENTALLPWLLVTVALHAAMVFERTQRAVRATAGAVLAAFVVSAAGVYLTRSGGTGSIHAFAESEAIGRALLAVAGVVFVTAVLVLVRYGPAPSYRLAPVPGREVGLLANAVLVGVAALVVAVGSFVPVVRDLSGGDRLLVKAHFYIVVLAPLGLAVGLLAAVGPALRWDGGVRRHRRLVTGAVGGAALGLVLLLWAGDRTDPAGAVPLVVASVALGTAAVLIGGELGRRGASVRAAGSRRRLGGLFAHAGFALLLIGAAGTALGEDREVFLAIGEEVAVGDRTIGLVGLTTGDDDRFEFLEAELSVTGDGGRHTLRPQLRAYEDQFQPTSEAALRSRLRGDLLVTVEAVEPELSGARIQIFDRPLVVLVWWGAIVMAAGGLLGLLSGRRPRRTGPRPSSAGRS